MDGSTEYIALAILLCPILLWAYEGLSYSPRDPESRADFLKLFVGNLFINLFCILLFDVGLRYQVLIALVLMVPARIYWIRPSSKHKPIVSGHGQAQRHLLAILGSGGHTGEMTSILRQLDVERYQHRTYIISSGDRFSQDKALELESNFDSGLSDPKHQVSSSDHSTKPVTAHFTIEVVPRARKIHQSLLSTPLTSLLCLVGCLLSIIRASHRASRRWPDIIITNGPATGVLVVLASLVLKFVGVAPRYKMKIIYVESWARVSTLSLSGKVLLRLGLYDRFLVQWERLQRLLRAGGYEHVEWEGFLVN